MNINAPNGKMPTRSIACVPGHPICSIITGRKKPWASEIFEARYRCHKYATHKQASGNTETWYLQEKIVSFIRGLLRLERGAHHRTKLSSLKDDVWLFGRWWGLEWRPHDRLQYASERRQFDRRSGSCSCLENRELKTTSQSPTATWWVLQWAEKILRPTILVAGIQNSRRSIAIRQVSLFHHPNGSDRMQEWGLPRRRSVGAHQTQRGCANRWSTRFYPVLKTHQPFLNFVTLIPCRHDQNHCRTQSSLRRTCWKSINRLGRTDFKDTKQNTTKS